MVAIQIVQVLKHGDYAMLGAAVVVIMLTVSVATFLRQKASGFWIGFTVAAWGWLVLAFATPTGPLLPPSTGIETLHSRLHPDPRRGGFYDPGGDAIQRDFEKKRREFIAAGQCVMAFMLGIHGGAASHLLLLRRLHGHAAVLPADGALLRPGWRNERLHLLEDDAPADGSLLRPGWRPERGAERTTKVAPEDDPFGDFPWT